MLKRIISFCIILAIVVVSMPIIPLVNVLAAETTETYSAGKPILAVDRVVNDFEGISTTGTATVGDYTVSIGIGTNTANSEWTIKDYSAAAISSKNTVTVDEGVLNSTLTGTSIFDFKTWLTPKSVTRGNTMPSSNSTALQFHVDFTGITSVSAGTKVTFEVEIALSKGTAGYYHNYCIPGKRFIYIPDATEENPTPEAQILTTGGGVLIDHGCVWGYAGQSGTLIVPIDVWDIDSSAFDIWTLYKKTSEYHHRSYIHFETYGKKYTSGEVFAIDDICWMKKITKDYDYNVIGQDFSSITTSALGGWGNGVTWDKGTNMTVTEDGKLKLTKTCEGEGRATTEMPITHWDDKYATFSFDFDASEMVNDTILGTGNSHIRMSYAVTKTSTTSYASCWFNGKFQFVSEDGTVTTATAYDKGAAIPHGFKGKIVVPASAVALSEDVKAGIAAGGTSLFRPEIMSLKASQKDTSVYIDNFTYHYNADQLDDTAGTDFTQLECPQYETVTPVTEDVRTVEAYFKTKANNTQSIIGTKFGNVSRHGKLAEISIISTGQLVLTIGSANIQVTDVALNDGKWHHVAMVADDTLSEIRCYVDGELAKTTTLEELTYPTMSDYLPLTIGNDMPAESKYYTVFDGSLANIRLWSDVRTAEELNDNKMVSVGKDAEGLVAEWMLDSESFTVETTGKYSLKNFYWNIDSENALFAQYNRDAAEDEFTIIFLPDTQTIIKNFAGQESDIFDWIIANAERLNIKAVVSLGDIIEYGTVESSFEALSIQYARLTEAGIPSVATIGDHDYNSFETRDSTYYDKYFNKNLFVENDYFRHGGLYDESTIMNGYYYLNIDEGAKYLIMNLEVQPRDEVIEWANSVIAENSDCRVIIATHKYMQYANCARHTSVAYNHGNPGETVWQELVSQHKNIDIILCGHNESSEGYYASYDEGVNGNQVLQVNCDLQNTDQSYKTLSAVLIGRFKNDGSQVSFNLYSAHHNLFINSDCNDIEYQLNAVAEADKVALADGVEYETLAEAVANGTDVKLLCDTEGEGLVINKDITIDFGGFTYTVTTPVGSTGTVSNGLQLLKGNNVTLKNGTLKVADDAKSNFYILVQNYTNLTVTDMVLDGTNLDKYSLTDGDSYTLSNNCGNVVVDGKTDIIANDEGDLAFAFDVYKSAYYDAPVVTVNTTGEIKGNIEVTAEIAENLNIEAGIFNTDVSAYIADGAGLKLIDGVYTIADAALIADIDASGKVDAADLSYIRQSLLEKISDGKVYDINGDGDIDIRDLVRIKKLAGE